MLAQQVILVVEDDPYVALDLQQTVEDLHGQVAGPARRLAEATALADGQQIAAAIIDCHVPDEDMLPLADLLAKRKVPFIIHAAGHLPRPNWLRHGNVPMLVKPLQARTVVARLIAEIRKSRRKS